MDAILLARIQFALTIGFHFFFPPISIGLAYFLIVIEGLGFFKKNKAFIEMARFFGKIFALTFAVGVGTGIVMAFQFGTNWGEFSKYVNDVFGPLLVVEVVFAFFLESSFLGIYLFGRGRVPGWLHWLSIIMVSLGATLSAFWILAGNSWMHTPSGFLIENGKVILSNFWQAVFNPSLLPRFFHTIMASILIGTFLICGILAFLILKKKETDVSKKILKVMIVLGLIFAIFQATPLGHAQIVEVEKNQKEKFATIEGVYKSGDNQPFLLFGIPTDTPPYVINKLEVPGLLSLMFELKTDYYIHGLEKYTKDERPPLIITFTTFHLMVFTGILMIGFMGICTFFLLIKKFFNIKLLMRLMIIFIPLPVIATQVGWMTTEIGRQPWIVYKVLKTINAVSVNVSAGQILFSIVLICIFYIMLLSVFIYLLVKTIRRGLNTPDAGIKEVSK